MKKSLSLILCAMMLMQSLVFTSFAEGKELTWSCEPMEGDISLPSYETGYNPSIGFVYHSPETKKYGIIDKQGNTLISPEYDSILYYYNNHIHAGKRIDDKLIYAVVNTKGEVTVDFGEYDSISKFSDDAIIAKKGEKYGIISPDGDVIIDFKYDELLQLTNGNYQIPYTSGKLCAKKDGKYGVIDMKEKAVVPFEHDYKIISYFDDKFYVVGRGYGGEKTYLLDENGKVLVDGDIRSIGCDGRFVSVLFNDDTPFVQFDKKGNKYDVGGSYIGDYYISYETDEYYGIFKDGKYGLADKNMNILIPCKYSQLNSPSNGNYFFTKTENESEPKWVDQNDNPIAALNACKDSYLTKSGDVIGIHKENGRYGMTDIEGNSIIPFQYEHIFEIADGLYIITTSSKEEGIAEFGTGRKVTDLFEGLILKIDSTKAIAFNNEVEMDAAPIIRNGRTMLPARFVAENLGATVSWDEATQTVTISKDIYPLQITIGSYETKVGPYTSKIDAPAFIENGRTYTPVRVIAEYLGAEISWDEATQTVKILK